MTGNLEWTGERLVTHTKGIDLVLEHLHRYGAACELVEGKRVLDVACGEGYGTNLLAQRAKSVVGVDIAPEAVIHAADKYGRTYLAGSCTALPFETDSFDVVVSFETLEHIGEADQLQFLAEIRRVLAPEGLLIICTPDKKTYTDERDYENEFHVKELYHEEFRELLSGHFTNVALYRQRAMYASVMLPDEGVPSRSGQVHADFSAAKFDEHFPTGMYSVAVCSNEELPALPCGVMTQGDGDFYKHRVRRMRKERQHVTIAAGVVILALVVALILT